MQSRALIVITMLSFLASACAAALGTVIYSGAFPGNNSTNLNTTVPATADDSGGEIGADPFWLAATTTNDFKSDGSVNNTASFYGAAYLPFVPNLGEFYTLSATLNDTTVANRFMAIGFTENSAVPTSTGGRMLDLSTATTPGSVGHGWILHRGGGYNGSTFDQLFAGPGSGGATNIPASLGQTTHAVDVQLVLDTTQPQWTTTWKMRDHNTPAAPYTQVGGPTALGASNPAINYIGLNVGNNVAGQVSNLKLESSAPTPVPLTAGNITQVAQTLLDSRGMTLQTNATYGSGINGQAFQFDAITTVKGYQYAAYWVKDASNVTTPYYLAIARRNLTGAGGNSAWQVANLTDTPFTNGLSSGVPNDAHNTVSLGVDPDDGTIHLSFDMHDNTLNYRVSDLGVTSNPQSITWSPSLFHARTNALGASGAIQTVTYPMFVNDPTGAMHLFIRRGISGNGSTWLYDYDGTTHAWGPGRQIDDGSTGDYTFTDQIGHTLTNTVRNAYPNGFNYDSTGRLQTSWVWREGTPYGSGSNHDIDYAYSDDNGYTWKNSAGQTISNVNGAGGLPTQITVNSPGIAIENINQYSSLMNTQAQAIDHENQPHILMWYLDPGTPYKSVWDPADSSYYHEWRDSSGVWHKNVIPRDVGGGAPGSRPRMVFDGDDNIYAIYTVRTGSSVGSNSIYFSQGELIISEASKISGWDDWHIVATEPGPFVNEPLIDTSRLAQSNILSVMMQYSPTSNLQATNIVVFDYALPEPGSMLVSAVAVLFCCQRRPRKSAGRARLS